MKTTCNIKGTLPENIKSIFAYIDDSTYNSHPEYNSRMGIERAGNFVILNTTVTLRSDANKEGRVSPVMELKPWHDNEAGIVVKLQGLDARDVELNLAEDEEMYGICIQPFESPENQILFACCPKDCGDLKGNDPKLFWKFPANKLEIQLLIN